MFILRILINTLYAIVIFEQRKAPCYFDIL